MVDESDTKILDVVTDFYLESNDFNGIPILDLQEKLHQEWSSVRGIIRKLVKEELVGVIDEDTDVNPHIIRWGFEPAHIQISKVEKDPPSIHLCIYPRPKHLEKVIDRTKYNREPYKLSLALGEAKLAYRSFELSVLEFYRNDPRYSYENDDIQGHIYYDSKNLADRDKVLLKFGFSYDDAFNRAVAVYLADLRNLTPEHQAIWQTKEMRGNYKLHPDYFRTTILGEVGEKVPICSAFLEELYIINKMCDAMGRPNLFNEDFGEYGARRPKKFGFLVRPTLQEFNDFILLFDKMLSDNINKDFFQREVAYETEVERGDGRVQVNPKGTLQILDDWMRKSFRTSDWQPWEESMKALRRVRDLRQKPAHSINEDQFDQKYFKEQREIIIEAYNAIRNIRLMFTNHPKVRAANIEVPDWLYEGKIWTM